MGIKCPNCQHENPNDTLYCGKCATSLHPKGEIPFSRTRTIQQPPKIITEGNMLASKYRIVEPIGKGGMGVVYKAEDTKLKRTVAVKFLPSELSDDSEASERFLREAQAAAALSHPNICTIHEINEEEREHFIVMEYVEGQSLKQKIKQGPLEQAEALDIAIQVAEGLEEAHGKGIIHRDIKPGNVMLTAKGKAKVMDFGLAKMVEASLITKEAITMGTVGYMSPEQARGEAVDHRTDIWSLGVVLYEMLTGQLPFKGGYDQSMIHLILSRNPEPLTKLLPTTPKALEDVVLTALAKNPAARYQSMGELYEDLQAVAAGFKPSRAKVKSSRAKILGLRKIHFYAGLTASFIIAFAAIFLLFLPSDKTLDSVAILPIVNESGDPEKEYFADGLTRELNTELYKVAALIVPPVETILTYKNSDKPPKKIAQELKVKAVVHVSWLQVKSKHRLIYTLSDPFRNRVIATDRLEMEEEDIIFLQRELARAVVGAIKVAVTPAEQGLLASGQKVDPKAYDLIMKGIAYALPVDGTDADDQKSLECLQKALELDPDLALAHAWLALEYFGLGINQIEDDKVVYPKAWKALDKALELDENLAIAFATRGYLKFAMNWDFAGADQDFEKALELAPGDMVTPLIYETFLCLSGRADKAIASIKSRTEKRKPVGLEGRYVERLSYYYLLAGRYDEALEELAKTPLVGHDLLNTYSAAKALKGSYTEALEIADKLRNQPGGREISYSRKNRAWILALAGQRKKALEALEEHVSIQAQKNIDTAFDEACIYAGLGEKDRVFELLYKSYENHSSGILYLVCDWSLHNLHSDHRFEDLKKKVGFPDSPSIGKR